MILYTTLNEDQKLNYDLRNHITVIEFLDNLNRQEKIALKILIENKGHINPSIKSFHRLFKSERISIYVKTIEKIKRKIKEHELCPSDFKIIKDCLEILYSN